MVSVEQTKSPEQASPIKFDSLPAEEHRIAIIGAGVAGVAMAAALEDYGINYVVFDKECRAGGLWANNYPEAKVQTYTELYEYPCKKFPPEIRNRKDCPVPRAEEVCQYLKEFIEEKQMEEHFRFNTYIRRVVKLAEHDFEVHFMNATTQSERFTYIINCTGLVSVKPNMIDIPGLEDFEWSGGTVLHSSQRRSDLIFTDQRVLVIGNGKSAVDAANNVARIATLNGDRPPLQMARRQLWYMPRFLFGLLQYKWVFHTRIGCSLLPRWYGVTNWILIVLHFLATPIKFIMFRLLELAFVLQYRIPRRLWPKFGTMIDTVLDVSALVTDEDHLKRLRSGEIDLRIGTVEKFEANRAHLSTGEVEEIDIVILATGWLLSHDAFMDKSSLQSQLPLEEDGIWLYRNILPPNLNGLAFVGANTLTFMNIYTSYVQAYWLAQLLAGQRPWPTTEHMTTMVEKDKAFKRKHYPKSVLRAASIEAFMGHYHDALFAEMNARKPFHWSIRFLADYLVPVIPSTMKGMLEPHRRVERKVKNRKRSRPST